VGLTYYELIAVNPTATTDEIERAYRRACKAYHPDLGGASANSALFREATVARDILVNPQRRREYDEEVRGGTERKSPFVRQPGSPEDKRASRSDQRTNTRPAGGVGRRRSRGGYFLLGLATSFYVGGRWITQLGFGLHFGLIEACGHQLVALSAIPFIAFFILSRKQVAGLYLRVRKVLHYRLTITDLRSRIHRTSARSQN
jgi:hypothetical protein